MQERKSVHLLKSLSSEEIRAFNRNYIKTAKGQIQKIFAFCRKYYPDFTHEKFNLTECVERTGLSSNRINSLLSELTKLLENYLVRKELEIEDNQMLRQQLLLEAYKKRNMDDYFLKSVEATKKILVGYPAKDIDYQYNVYLLNKIIYQYIDDKKSTIATEALVAMVNSLETFCMSSILKYQCLLTNLNDILPTTISFLSPKSILHIINENKYCQSNVLVNTYYELFLSLNKKTEELEHIDVELLKVKEMYIYAKKYIYLFKQGEQMNILIWLINICIKRYQYYQDKEQNFLKLVLEIYKIGLNQNICIINGQLEQAHFANIFTIAMLLKEYQWAKKEFIPQYSPYLKENEQENIRLYYTARIAFAEKQYQEAISLLNQFKNNNSYDFINERILLLKSYYEEHCLNGAYFDELERLIQSFSRYLDRAIREEKKTKAFIAPFKNFVHFVKYLFEERYTKQHLMDVLSNTQSITDRNWLLEKIGLCK